MPDPVELEEYTPKWWAAEITASEKFLDEEWRKAAEEAVKRYLDDRRGESETSPEKKYNIFWANVQIIKAALYATPPKPEIKRQHDDSKDDIARTAALILERIINFGLDKDCSDMHESFKLAVDDLLIPGLGQVWMRYAVETEPTPPVPAQTNPMTGQVMVPAQEAGLRIVHEDAPTDYVHWRDFLFSVSRTWREVWWAGRRCWMKKKAFTKRFSQAKWDKIKETAAQAKNRGEGMPKEFSKGRVEVFEVWCKETNKAYWVHKALDEFLDEQPDPMKLEDFFPCPMPVLATHTTNAFVPRSDYSMAGDQYVELDVLNSRISTLTTALRVVGVYDKDSSELAKMLTGGEMLMIPVENWAMFAEKGGLDKQVDWFPVDLIAEVLERLMLQRQAVITQIYELTSISDIQRGASNPRETLGAQKLKAQYSSVRLQLKQQDVGQFVRHAIRLKCEIICKHWQPETIVRVSQIEQTESGQYAQQAVDLLKNWKASQYRVEVGEETLSLADYNAERELRTEYLTAVGQFVSQAASALEFAPDIGPLLFKLIAWVTASFRGASDIETILDQAIQVASQPKPAQPDPAVVEANAKKELAQMQEESRKQIAQSADQTRKDIAEINAKTTKDVAELNNGTKILIEQMANTVASQAEDNKAAQETMRLSMEEMTTRAQMAHEALLQIMSGQQERDIQTQKDRAEGKEHASEELKSLMKELTGVMSKPRKRIPTYDKKTGDITEVTETLGE